MTTHIERAQQNFGEMLMKWHNNGEGESINPEFGQLLLFVGIYLNNTEMIDTAFNNYPEKSNPNRLLTPWAYSMLEQLRMLEPVNETTRSESPTSIQDIKIED